MPSILIEKIDFLKTMSFKRTSWEQVLWSRGVSCPLCHLHLVSECLVQVLAVLPPTQLPAHVPAEAADGSSSICVHALHVGDLDGVSGSSWPSPDCWGHLGSEPVDGWFLLLFSLSNKSILKHTKKCKLNVLVTWKTEMKKKKRNEKEKKP